MKNIFLSLGLASVLFSCSKQNNAVIVDNPTDKAISFEVDGKPYKMEPNSTQEIELENGNHTLKTPEGEEINFEKSEWQSGSILNPTNSEYVLYTEAYTEIPFEQNRMYKMMFKNVKIDGKTYYAPIEITGGYYIPHRDGAPWKFGLDEDFTETIDIQNYKEGSTYNLMIAKIYRKKDFAKKHAGEVVEDEVTE